MKEIFKKYVGLWSQFRLFLLKALYGIAVELERHTVLTITMEIISEVAEVMGNKISVGIRIN